MTRNSLLILLLLCSVKVLSQQGFTSVADKEKNMLKHREEQQVEYLYKLYSLKIGTGNELINGKEYFQYYYRSKLKPLLFIDRTRKASIILDGRKYDNISLQYDTYTDEVIYSDTANKFNLSLYRISLNKNNIDEFILFFEDDTLNFRYFEKNDFTDSGPPDGFYELAYNGATRYLIRHRSRVHERNGIDEYFYSPAGYIQKGDYFIRIKSVKQLLKLIGVKYEDVKNKANLNNINIRKANKKQIISILKYYDSLSVPAKI